MRCPAFCKETKAVMWAQSPKNKEHFCFRAYIETFKKDENLQK
jgi:hypothetical protein